MKQITAFIVAAALALSFPINSQAAQICKAGQSSCKLTYKKGENKMADVKLARYSDFSTSTMFIAVKIKNSNTGETAEIAIDNSSWMLKCKSMGLVPSSKEYPEYMKAHSNDEFAVSAEDFNKLSALKSGGAFDFLKKEPEKIKEYITGAGPEPDSFYIDERKCRPMTDFICAAFSFNDILIKQRCIDGKMFLKIVK